MNGFAPFFNFNYFCTTFLKHLETVSYRKEHQQETIIYLALWALLFLAPVMSLAIRTSHLDEIWERAKKAGVKVNCEPGYVEKLRFRNFLIEDPNGVELEILQRA